MNDLDDRTVHFGARDYDPHTGRWVQADPTGSAGGANRYAYANSDAINFTDPTGEIPKDLRIQLCGMAIVSFLCSFPNSPPPLDPGVNPQPRSRYTTEYNPNDFNDDMGKRPQPKPKQPTYPTQPYKRPTSAIPQLPKPPLVPLSTLLLDLLLLVPKIPLMIMTEDQIDACLGQNRRNSA